MASEISVSPVVFSSGGTTLAGRVHRGTDDPLERRPGVLVTGSWLTVKEQMADAYAAELAARGYTAITFDFTGWGSSGGDPRHFESPSRKIADIAAAAAFASTLSFIQPGGVAYLGICASAQYALAAIAGGAPISTLISVAGWFHDTESVAPFYGGMEGVRQRLEAGEQALERYLTDGRIDTVPAYDPGNERAGMSFELDYYADPTRGAIPQWPNRMAQMSWLPWLTFDGLSAAPSVEVPCLFVHSDGCVFPEHVTRLGKDIAGPVDVRWGVGTQTDFYDRPEHVGFAVDAATEHLDKVMNTASHPRTATVRP